MKTRAERAQSVLTRLAERAWAGDERALVRWRRLRAWFHPTWVRVQGGVKWNR